MTHTKRAGGTGGATDFFQLGWKFRGPDEVQRYAVLQVSVFPRRRCDELLSLVREWVTKQRPGFTRIQASSAEERETDSFLFAEASDP